MDSYADYVKSVLDTAPPLSSEKRARITRLLSGGDAK